MAKLAIADEISLTATVRRRVNEDRVSVSIPTYGFPHSIRDSTSKVKRGDKIELTGTITRIDDDSVTIDIGALVTVSPDVVTLVSKYQPPKRKKPLVDTPD
ncbi:hypothetical protein [Mesorhizobium sp. M8A.F.Ca.ET.021.01.1.1]|uniref:hypothetical protein n=1 Tax=Mesorhizobium sp. M8A.F.Ca.ET.021.01.1.1 TaxID=2496757 RepID=UPI000FCCA2AB|nr:hypothetical protein [Mesorhizobium sp. M8A.F.Ca.ET.021.01.1.1]RUW56844.1 hypothetical protein EOA36_02270 [Mesorhizobium sp. M8A.F.Ca.ET.021.01.1.1]